MQHPFLVGTKLYLRPLGLADLDGPYLGWLNDQETIRFLDSGRFPTTRTALEEAFHAKQTDSLWLAIVDRKTDCHIGNIKLGPINLMHRYASLGILIGDPSFRGKGFAREAIELVLKHAFTQLGLNKVTAGAYTDHVACLELFKRLGFSVEGRQRNHLYREGAYHDKVLMGLLREEYLERMRKALNCQSVAAPRRRATKGTKRTAASAGLAEYSSRRG